MIPVYASVITTESRSGLRADACRNRQRIVDAARDVFVEHGADASLDEIARRAGVGNATLYRRFPDRAALIRAVGMEITERLAREAGSALAEEPDAFQALRRFAHAVADQRVGAVLPALAQYAIEDEQFLAVRDRAMAATEDIINRGIEAGLVRPDVAVSDLLLPLIQLTRPLPGAHSGGTRAESVHRHLELLLDGLRTPQQSRLPGAPLALADLREVCARTPSAN